MNLYVVEENQFPEGQMVMICACNTEEEAATAYVNLWLPQSSDISSIVKIGECNYDNPRVLWKNFLMREKPIENGDNKKEDEPEKFTPGKDYPKGGYGY